MEQIFTQFGLAGAVLFVLWQVLKQNTENQKEHLNRVIDSYDKLSISITENTSYLRDRNGKLDSTLLEITKMLEKLDERQNITNGVVYEISKKQNEQGDPIPAGVRRAAAQCPEVTDEELREGIEIVLEKRKREKNAARNI